jgi:hypothetical protein
MDPTCWQNMISHNLLWFTAVYCEDLWGKARLATHHVTEKIWNIAKKNADLLGWVLNFDQSLFSKHFSHQVPAQIQGQAIMEWTRWFGWWGGMGRLTGNHWFTSKISKFNLGGPNRPLVLYQSVLWFFHQYSIDFSWPKGIHWQPWSLYLPSGPSTCSYCNIL